MRLNQKSKMATFTFQDCLMGILKDKSILYVTHQVEFLPAADLILVCHEDNVTFSAILFKRSAIFVLSNLNIMCLSLKCMCKVAVLS